MYRSAKRSVMEAGLRESGSVDRAVRRDEEEALAALRQWGSEVISIAREARAATFGNARTKRDPFDLVTRIDDQIERLITERIVSRFPDHCVVGEEGTRVRAGSAWRWIIDPIDGTFNYATGLPGSGCSVALDNGDEVRVGAIMDFTSGITFSARRGFGLLADPPGRALDTKDADASSEARVFLEFGTERFSPDVGHALADLASVRPIVPRLVGSAAIALLASAIQGGCFIGVGLKEWDVAAGILLAQEAGRSVRSWPDDSSWVHVLVGTPADLEGFSPVVEGVIGAWRRTASASSV